MSFNLDPELAQAIREATRGGTPPPPIPPGDLHALRTFADGILVGKDASEPESPEVTRVDHAIPVSPGETILGRWYQPGAQGTGAAVIYFHGGGMVSGSVALYDRFVARYPQQTGVPFLAVDYRLAPEHPGTRPAEDGFAAVRWLAERAPELGVDPRRIAVMGDSGGGGVAAAVAIIARDARLCLAAQILMYPMLDDRTTVPDPQLTPFARWTYEHNHTAWQALLGSAIGGPDVSPLSAPARLADLSGLAPAFVDVGELDIFRDEGIEYAQRLLCAGVSTELYVRRGAPHGFDRIGPAAVADRSWRERCRFIASL